MYISQLICNMFATLRDDFLTQPMNIPSLHDILNIADKNEKRIKLDFYLHPDNIEFFVNNNHLSSTYEYFNEKDGEGNTPLNKAIYKYKRTGRYMYVRACYFLIENEEVDLDEVNSNGKTPLQSLIQNLALYSTLLENKELCRLIYILVQQCHRMNINVQNKDGNTVLHELVKMPVLTNNINGLELYFSDKKFHYDRYKQVIHETLNYLLNSGLDVTIKDNDGNTALRAAYDLDNDIIYVELHYYILQRNEKRKLVGKILSNKFNITQNCDVIDSIKKYIVDHETEKKEVKKVRKVHKNIFTSSFNTFCKTNKDIKKVCILASAINMLIYVIVKKNMK